MKNLHQVEFVAYVAPYRTAVRACGDRGPQSWKILGPGTNSVRVIFLRFLACALPF